VAATGELTLTGHIASVAGILPKVTAACRDDYIDTVLLPMDHYIGKTHMRCYISEVCHVTDHSLGVLDSNKSPAMSHMYGTFPQPAYADCGPWSCMTGPKCIRDVKEVPEDQLASFLALPHAGQGLLALHDFPNTVTPVPSHGPLVLSERTYLAPITLLGRDAQAGVSQFIHLALETESTALVGVSSIWQVLKHALDTETKGAFQRPSHWKPNTITPV
jgi:hypothetical protein